MLPLLVIGEFETASQGIEVSAKPTLDTDPPLVTPTLNQLPPFEGQA